MSNFEKKEQNLNQLIDKLNSLSLSYSQPNYELEKIRTEKNEVINEKYDFRWLDNILHRKCFHRAKRENSGS